jgi:DNA repair protein RadC
MPAEPRPRTSPENTKTKPHYHGHRQRLRARLIDGGAEALPDYELLELLLFAAIPRRDVKPLLNAPVERLRAAGLSEAAAAMLRATGAVALRAHKSAALKGPLLNSWQRIVDYCRAALAPETKEQFRLLFFDRKNHLLAEEVHQRGTIDHTPVYPREVVQRALEVGAGALVLVHNHPSGDVTPSKDDIEMTRAIAEACRPLGIAIHDHLIIGGDQVASFKALGLL